MAPKVKKLQWFEIPFPQYFKSETAFCHYAIGNSSDNKVYLQIRRKFPVSRSLIYPSTIDDAKLIAQFDHSINVHDLLEAQ